MLPVWRYTQLGGIDEGMSRVGGSGTFPLCTTVWYVAPLVWAPPPFKNLVWGSIKALNRVCSVQRLGEGGELLCGATSNTVVYHSFALASVPECMDSFYKK